MSLESGDREVVCQVGEHRFTLPVASVREVCTGFGLVRVPGVAPPVEGVANIRGTLITVVRGADLLGVTVRSPGPSAWLVVLVARDGRVGLGVDDVLDLEAPGSTLPRLDVDGAIDAVFGGSP